MTRREARILAFSLIFEREFNSESTIEEIYECAKENREFEDNEYALSAFRGTQEHESEILSLVEENSQGWKINRISKISMSIIKLAVYEMLYTDIPLKVSINEAVELAKAYDDEKAYSFVNGILHALSAKAPQKD